MEATNTLTVRLPKEITLKHLPAYKYLDDKNISPIDKMEQIVCNIVDVSREQIKHIVLEDLVFLYKKCLVKMALLKLQKAKKEIEINGQTYVLINPIKQPISWVIDSNALVNENNPEMIAAFMYLEKETVYGELDQNANIKHSVIDRSLIFKDFFSVKDYLPLVQMYADAVVSLNKIFNSKTSNNSESDVRPYAWEDLILATGKHFNLSFFDTIKLNAKTFKHYTDVYFHYLKMKIQTNGKS